MSELGLEPITEDDQPEAPRESAPGGPFQALAQRRRELEEQGTREWEHPGYEGIGLFVTYRRLPAAKSREILHGEDGGSIVERNAQLLVESAESVVWRHDGQEEFVAPGYDDDFAAKLEIKVNTRAEMDEAHQAVLGSFGGHDQPMLVHAAEVYAWMFSLRKSEDARLLGESAGTRTSR